MKLTRLVKDENGNYEATVALTEPQVTFCADVGLGILMAAGAAELLNMTREQPEAEVKLQDEHGAIIH